MNPTRFLRRGTQACIGLAAALFLILCANHAPAADQRPLVMSSTQRPVPIATGDNLYLPQSDGTKAVLATSGTGGTVTLTLPAASTDLVGDDTTQTLTNKSLTAPTITGTWTATGATVSDLGTVTTADINGGTLDGTVIGGNSAAAATVTSLTATGNISGAGTIHSFGSGSNGTTYLAVSAASGQSRTFRFQTAGSNRWAAGTNTAAESGADAGANYVITAYSDAGTTIDNPITIVRQSNGLITFARPTTQATNWSQTGATTFSTGTGAVSLNGAVTCSSGVTVSSGNLTVTSGINYTGNVSGDLNTDSLIITSGGATEANIEMYGTGSGLAGYIYYDADLHTLRTANGGTTLAIFQNSGITLSKDVTCSSTLSAGGTITSDSVFFSGSAGSGTGGNYRTYNDAGTLQWTFGILGSVGAKDWDLYDNVAGASRITVSGTTGAITLAQTTVLGADKSLVITGGSSDPGSPVEGQIFWRTDTNKLRVYDGSSWVDLN